MQYSSVQYSRWNLNKWFGIKDQPILLIAIQYSGYNIYIFEKKNLKKKNDRSLDSTTFLHNLKKTKMLCIKG